ncbi:hypothetical protein JX265_009532 [Neoarthrinium moseri]|uniref:Microtubule associated protein n=1 Tax=Neoarthrinium moseri TaxID=1658444 RepID=A0A9Q0AJ70_9PEZI|nr:uncharacterized protein JN550_010675 [Neoarthrinium moseri]KAI1861565.1 hypothetical protein JX265_009532 [Neoarthrinium moseri]KAI1861735.1 hypothetical protein JN550_010675 [Neoarthrinium moseri]
MSTLEKSAEGGFSRAARKIYNPIGFSKGYNFVLWFIFSGALMGFTLARLPFLNFYGFFCGPAARVPIDLHTPPGECFYYLQGHTKVGILLHLATILPASFLVCFQFVPIIRHRLRIFHRINGYLVILLSLVSTAGAFMLVRHAFDGEPETQIFLTLLGIMFLIATAMAYINIKRLQIEQHRAWMLRAWFYAASIITLRIITKIAAPIISQQGGYYTTRMCSQIASIYSGSQNITLALYPNCAPYFAGGPPDLRVMVRADLGGNVAEKAAAAGIFFGSAGWLALTIHAIGIEIYLQMTPAEHERLRNVSYQRQVEAGMRNPGRAGLTVDRLGDSAKWVPNTDS